MRLRNWLTRFALDLLFASLIFAAILCISIVGTHIYVFYILPEIDEVIIMQEEIEV